MIARILFPETVGCSDPEICKEVCGSESGCSNIAYPTLVINLMPPGARGMMLAVMLSALMSSLTSIFNSSSTIFAMDLWTHFRKKASELEVMIVGRFFVVVLVVISIIWVPVLRISQGAQLYVYIQAVSSFLQPPICCVFLLAVFWSRLNEKGAFSALVIGLLLGLVRFIVEYSYPKPQCTENVPDPAPAIVKDFHYLYFSAFLFFVTGIVAVGVSMLTKPIDPRCLHRLTYWTRHSKEPRLDIDTLHHSDSTSSASSSEKSDKDIELDKLRAREYDIPEVGEGDVKKDGKIVVRDESLEEGKLLTKEDQFGDGTNGPVVVVEDESTTRIIDNMPWYRRIVNWVCGIDNATGSSAIANKQVQTPDMLSIKQNKRWKISSNTAAVLIMIIAVSICVVFR